jgi:hypothetical protein
MDQTHPHPPITPASIATTLAGQCFILAMTVVVAITQAGADEPFDQTIMPVLRQYCTPCHSAEQKEGELDLEQFATAQLAIANPNVWTRVLQQIADGEMPPENKPQLPDELKGRFTRDVRDMLHRIAIANAGDPGEVVLRRLSNVEYTYTLRDLTGIATLAPAKEFPIDGAAGEGFTNTGAALVMSPTLLTKYLDAAKGVADHAVLLPDGIGFSASTSRRDWTNEALARIRQFYLRFAEPMDQSVEVGGAGQVSNDGGRIALKQYLTVLTQYRSALDAKTQTIATLATEHNLNAKYLEQLWEMLSDDHPSLILDSLRLKWRAGHLNVSDIEPWQNSLWRFTNVGHLGKAGGPKAWMEPASPLVPQQQFKVNLSAPDDGQDVLLYLFAGDAGDGNADDIALWENGRIVTAGRPDLMLKDVRWFVGRLEQRRSAIAMTATRCLDAAHEATSSSERIDVTHLAQKHEIDPALLSDWLTLLGISTTNQPIIGPLLTNKAENVGGYSSVRGWSGPDAFSILTNSSDAAVQIPGTILPHSIVTHPSPSLASVIAWRSPIVGNLKIGGSIQDADTACGNGVTWMLEVRRGEIRNVLARGVSEGNKIADIGPFEQVSVRTGDLVTLTIGPRDGSHVCDLTAVQLTIDDGENDWDLVLDVAPDILAGNPHPDRHGNDQIWYFFGEPETDVTAAIVQEQSLLASWRQADSIESRRQIAGQLQQQLMHDLSATVEDPAKDTADSLLLDFSGPLFASLYRSPHQSDGEGNNGAASQNNYGVDPSSFGNRHGVEDVSPTSICVKAPSLIEVRLPPSLVDGAQFIVEGRLHPSGGDQASVQMQVLATKPESMQLRPGGYSSELLDGAWTSSQPSMAPAAPILVRDASIARHRLETAFEDFRQLFPAALCYTTIVPVDEVVTLTLFHREDEPLVRLMLDDDQRETLDRLWAELHFVSQDALTLVDAYEQIWQFSTQDGPDAPHGDKRLEPLREPILRAAEAFEQHLVDVEPVHLQSLVDFASRAWRRPLSEAEQQELRDLYLALRSDDVPHDKAIRLSIARVLTSPAFLYRGEQPPPGRLATQVNDWELATRLSYFLWASTPDEELRALAAEGKLGDKKVLADQSRRMLRDDKVRRLATEFGCQWLHVRDLESLDEKSERHFPTFVALRADMQEEVVRFFVDMFQTNQSVLSLIDANHSFMNAPLATHYGIDVASDGWQRVEGLHSHGRGGILGFAATLAKQSGASRTSPILRGNWISEVVLGEKLPRPPKDVPVLPERAPEGLTERQLIERHSSDPSCARCHDRIDPFGFALEGFDAIGRARSQDAAGLPIDTSTTTPAGVHLHGMEGLRDYLLEQRRDDFLRQFCRKLLGYSLGRSIQLSDQPLLDDMLEQMKENEFRVGTAIEMIVASPQFREIRGRSFATDTQTLSSDHP